MQKVLHTIGKPQHRGLDIRNLLQPVVQTNSTMAVASLQNPKKITKNKNMKMTSN